MECVQRASRNEGDLVAKFYFVKKKLVWEFLQGPIKYKIEIPWSHIIGINAVMEKNQPGILRIEVFSVFLRLRFDFLNYGQSRYDAVEYFAAKPASYFSRGN